MRVLFFLFFLSLCLCTQGLVVVGNDETRTELDSRYSTLGPLLETPTIANITIVTKSNLDCGFKSNLHPDSISGHWLVYVDFMFEEELYKHCANYFFDEVANAGFFARIAQRHGALGVLIEGFHEERKYTGYRVTGFSKKVDIPVLVAPKETISYFKENQASINRVEIPAITNEDESFIHSLRRAYRALNILNCIVWPILTVLTAYFIYEDLRQYAIMDSAKRTIHPTLTKAAPCFSGLCVSIWHIVDPFNYKLIDHFPATFLKRFYFGFIFVTAFLLLKTWILAVGDKLTSERIFRYSILTVNILIGLTILMTILWVAIGSALLVVAVVFGAITAVVCGVGFVYFGKDIVMILSKQSKSVSMHKHLSQKIIIFTVVFVLSVYAAMLIYLLDILGTTLSEFLMQFILGTAFSIIYSVLFIRKRRLPNSPANSSAGARKTNSNNSKNSNTSNQVGMEKTSRNESEMSSSSIVVQV